MYIIFPKSGESVHIGYYCFNCNIIAKEVILDASNGQLYGGNIKADIRVRAPIIGSEIEKKTFINIIGFDRNALTEQLNDLCREISKLQMEQQKLKKVLAYFDEQDESSCFQHEQYEIKVEIKSLEDTISTTYYAQGRELKQV